MWRSKKFLLVAVLAIMVLAGSIGGIALAQTENDDDSQPKTLLVRVAAKLGIDQQELEDAFGEAQSEMRAEALDSYLEKLVADGVIDPGEATAYKEWWQARPNIEPFQQQLREWEQARPDVSIGFGFKGHGGFRGMYGMRGFGGPCAPIE